MSNYFAVGLGLIEHLEAKAEEWGVKHVGISATIGQINKNITPAIYVINTGNNPIANKHVDSRDVQQWTVVVVVSNQASQTDFKALMRSSGELVSKVINHVQGYQLAPRYQPLQRSSTSGGPDYYSTFAFYPFTFNTQFQP